MAAPTDHITGKTKGMLKRLPHFYDPAEVGDLLLQFVEVFGRRLERAEQDLYRVLRAHHVQTADNEGSRGYTAKPSKRGDLDKIFALYLEVLGGTSQLIKMNPLFTERSLDVRQLARRLMEDDTPLIAYLKGHIAPATWALLARYHVANTTFDAEEIQPGFVLELLVGQTPLSKPLHACLSPETQALLAAYGGEAALDPALTTALVRDLNERILPDPSLFRKQYAFFESLRLPPPAQSLIFGIHRTFLQVTYGRTKQPGAEQKRLLEVLRQAEPVPTPPGDDLKRLNRMLLEAAYPYDEATRPWGFRPRGIPSLRQVRTALVEAFNGLLAAADLYTPDRFPDVVEDFPFLQKRYQDEPIWLNRQLFESAFPLAVEKSYAPYRERLRGLIEVLRHGASTRRGVVDIVAANLGIVSDDPAARAARALIEIEEFLPRQTWFFEGDLPFLDVGSRPAASFEINNTNPSREQPEIWVTMLESPVAALENITFVDASGKSARFPGRILPGDRLVFREKSVWRNGIVPPEGLVGEVAVLKKGISRWRFEADVVAEDGQTRPGGRFDGPTGLYDTSVFLMDDAVVRVEVKSYRYTPGVFTVTIPWHIDGFTDKFAETQDHPRHLILTLINRVKASGVRALVAYKQVFAEEHEHTAGLALTLEGPLLQHEDDTEDAFEIASRQLTAEAHQTNDRLVLSGAFDYTAFDTLNTFA